MKKSLKIIGIILLILLIAYISLIVWTHFRIKRGDLVKWDNVWYTKEALLEKYPPQVYEVEAKNTPEEVYTIFRQALLDDDIDGALGVMSDYRKSEYQVAFSDGDKLTEWIQRLPEKILEDDSYGNFASYYYLNNIDERDARKHPVSFSKNKDGYWEIDSI